MRKLLAAAVLVLGGLGAVACQPTEPAMTISAKVYDELGETPPGVTCGLSIIFKGKVTPATATPKVVLQQSSSGKWTDVKGWADNDLYYGYSATLRQANVSQATGSYSIPLLVMCTGSTRHFRVRSAGGGTVSGSLYAKPTGIEGVCS